MSLAEPTNNPNPTTGAHDGGGGREAELRKRLDAQPDSAGLWIELGEVLAAGSGGGEHAADAFSRAAHLLVDAGHPSKALELFERATSCASGRAADFDELAKTYHQLGRFRDAFGAYQSAYRMYLDGERLMPALGVLERMIRLKPDDVELQLERARKLEDVGERQEALDAYASCVEVFERTGRTEEFLEVAEHMLELDPEAAKLRAKVVEALLAEAEVLVNLQLYDRAQEALDRADEYAPSNAQVREKLVCLYERRREPMAFIEAVGELARRVDRGPQRAAPYLRRAIEWMGSREHIEQLAETLEVDLSEVSDGGDVPPACAQGLGDQVTQPKDESMPAFSRESTRDHGLLIGGECRTKNLLALLQSVERASSPTRIILQDGDGEPFAQMTAHDGRLDVGVEIDGEVFIDKTLQRVSDELCRRLEAAGGDAGAKISGGEVTTGERSQLYRLTARALVRLAEVGEGQQFCLRACSQEVETSERLSFSPFSLLVRAASYMQSDSRVEAASFYERISESERAEEAWLMVEADAPAGICLPIRTSFTYTRTLKDVRLLGRTAHDVLTYARRVAEHIGEHDIVAPTFIFDDGLWCAFCSGAQVALVRTERLQLGYIMGQARISMEGEGQ